MEGHRENHGLESQLQSYDLMQLNRKYNPIIPVQFKPQSKRGNLGIIPGIVPGLPGIVQVIPGMVIQDAGGCVIATHKWRHIEHGRQLSDIMLLGGQHKKCENCSLPVKREWGGYQASSKWDSFLLNEPNSPNSD